MNKYRVFWWEERIIRNEVDVEATDDWEAQEKAMDGDIGNNQIHTELHNVTNSGHIKTILIKGDE